MEQKAEWRRDMLNVKYLLKQEAEMILVSRSGTERLYGENPRIKEHITQDLTGKNWKTLAKSLQDGRVVYFPATHPYDSLSLEEHNKINVEPVEKILDIISVYHLPFVYLSTDMVFGGENRMRNEKDFPKKPFLENPFGYYSASKRKGEELTLSHHDGFVVRLGNVLGIKEDFLTSVAKNLGENKDYFAWSNVSNKFSIIDDVSSVLNLLRGYDGYQRVFHVASEGQPISRYHLAREFIKLCEEKEILPKNTYTKIRPSKAPLEDGRPSTLALDTRITSKALDFHFKDIFSSLKRRMTNSNYPFLENQ